MSDFQMMSLLTSVPSGAVLPEYTRVRVPDDHAIADLAMYNYVEVLHTPLYLSSVLACILFYSTSTGKE